MSIDVMLTDRERGKIGLLLDRLRHAYSGAEDPLLLMDAALHARQLPTRIQQRLHTFRREEPGSLVIRGHDIDAAVVGPTPDHWSHLPKPSPTLDQDLLLVLYGSLLGDVFGWTTQQDGRVVHDVLPIREHQGKQLGTAADVVLDWHTEDAFHPLRPDWVILACLRNPTGTETTLAHADTLRIGERDLQVLFEPRFRIMPDHSHLPQHNSSGAADFTAIEELTTAPPALALMWGDPRAPYIRADKSFWTVADPADAEAIAVLARLAAEIERNLRDVVLESGDFLFIDNFKAVHGRKPFPARYDGTDRWLKRVCVTRDLRTSRGRRQGVLNQVIG